MNNKPGVITKVTVTDYTVTDVNPEDGVLFKFSMFKDTRQRLGLKFGKKESQCLKCDKKFEGDERMYMIITNKGNYFVCEECADKLRKEIGKPKWCKPENQHLNKKVKI